MAKEEYKSRVYTDRPAYADFIKAKAITTTSAGIDVAAAEPIPDFRVVGGSDQISFDELEVLK